MIQRLHEPIRPKRRTRLRRWLSLRTKGFRIRKKEGGNNAKRRRRTMLESIGWKFDELFSVAFPIAGGRRMAQRQRNEAAKLTMELIEQRGFSGVRNDEYRGDRWSNIRGDMDSLMETDLRSLQTRCEELARDNIVARSAIDGRKTNEVGIGILCQPMVKETANWITKDQADEINRQLRDFTERWSQYGVDKSRLFTLPQYQRQVVGQLATFGEAFILFGDSRYFGSSSFAMELIHPSRVETPPKLAGDPKVRLGVQYDDDDLVVGYWVRSRHPDDHKRFEVKYDYFPRFDEKTGQMRMCHVFEPLTPGQSRGLPWLAWVMNRCKDLDDYWEAELINKQIEACFGVYITGGRNGSSPMDEANANLTETKSDGTRIEEMSPGTTTYLNYDAEVNSVDPQRPGATFAPFIEWSLRSIAAALNYPYELLAKNFFRITYSSGRLSMLDGRMGFRVRVKMIIDMWLSHVHRRLVHEAMVSGQAPIDVIAYQQRRELFERHSWRGQNRGLMDPEKENKGHMVGLKGEFESRTGILVDRGDTVDDLEQELMAEGKQRIEREVQLAKYRRELEEQAGLNPGSSQSGVDPEDDNESPEDPDEADSQESRQAA